jgi:hypothetical protein
MKSGNASGLWTGRDEFFNSGTQPHLPNSSSSANRAYTSYQGAYNGSLQNQEYSHYAPQPRPASSLPPYVQNVETVPDHRGFDELMGRSMRPPLNMPHNNLDTFHDINGASAKDNGAAGPLHVTQTQWERYKAEIKRIYLDEDRSLADTMQHMESLGFAAS